MPTDLAGQVAIDVDSLPHALGVIAKSDHIAEVVILSTCVRTEVYIDAVRFHGAVDDVHRGIAFLTGASREDLNDHFFELHDASAVSHLFRVAAGLESAVVGETEVLGQVRRAWETGRAGGTSRAILDSLFKGAVRCGRRARSETSIGRGVTSIAHAAVVMATRESGQMNDKTVLVVGAGEMSRGMASAVGVTGRAGVLVANRTQGRASELATLVGGRAIEMSEIPSTLEEVDVVLSSTGSREPVITRDDVAAALERAQGRRRMVIVDMAVPNDVDPEVRQLDGVTVIDLSDLENFVDNGLTARKSEIESVLHIVEHEVGHYLADSNARIVTPAVRAMRQKAESIRNDELDRAAGQLSALTPEQRECVDALTKAMMAKLFHAPSVKLKETAGSTEGERLAEAARVLFGL